MNYKLLNFAEEFDVDGVREVLNKEGFGTQKDGKHILCCMVDHYKREQEQLEKGKEIINLFVKHGFELSACRGESETLFEYCATWGVIDDFGEFLMKYGISQEELDCALRNAAYNHYHRCVGRLIGLGANPTSANKDGKTALMFAAIIGNYKCLRRCLRASDEEGVCKVDNKGRTALMYSAMNAHLDCFYALIAHGAKLDTVDKYGKSLYDIIYYHMTSGSTYGEEDFEMYEYIKKRVYGEKH